MENKENSPLPEEGEEAIEEEIPKEIIEDQPAIFQLLITLLEDHHICSECLGRQFSYLATGTNNGERATSLLLMLTMECHGMLRKATITEVYQLYGKNPLQILALLAKKADFMPAKQTIKKWLGGRPDFLEEYDLTFLEAELLALSNTDSTTTGPEPEPTFNCDLCDNLLLPPRVKKLAELVVEATRGYDFENFLIGSRVHPGLVDREDEFRFRYHLQNGETIKANLNRLLGKLLQKWWDKPTHFTHPDIQITVNQKDTPIKIIILPKSLFIKGKYRKYVRTLPQTHWHCFRCRGRGKDKYSRKICPECHGTGDKYPSSVQDLIANPLLKMTRGQGAAFHGGGREDLDARCLGKGRAFIIEIKRPIVRFMELGALAKAINDAAGGEINVTLTDYVTKKDVISLKSSSETAKKTYDALVYFDGVITPAEFASRMQIAREKLLAKPIAQRTPMRVVHRRADKTRNREIYRIEGKYIDPVHGFFTIQAQGGTYIKELISSDNSRTSPSLTGIFGMNMLCVELDIIDIAESVESKEKVAK